MASAVHGVRPHIDALREKVEVNLVTSISERRFLPIEKFREIFTLPAIKAAVQELEYEAHDRINLANTIFHDGKALFAMLIDLCREDLIITFRKHGVLDSQFPLDKARAEEIVGPFIGRKLVSEVQWRFLPFVFPERMWECPLHIEDPTILPFVSCEQIGFGAFGDVEKIGISPSQQSFSDQSAPEVYVIRKQLKAGAGKDDFEREEKCLRLLNGLRHPNIVPFLGSYTHKKEYNFLFPCIETDLGKFLASECRHGEFRWDFTFYAALTGLASALAKTHRLVLKEEEHGIQVEAIGYHHDIRPPNVLVNQDSFILADFGLGSLKDAGALSHTPYKVISGDYIAPECTDMEEIPQTVNRAIDVWAFGCLILEVVTYMLKGPDGVRKFRKKRLTLGRLPRWKDSGFYQPQAHGGVKQEVVDWIEELRRSSATTDTEVYLLKLSLDALQAEPGKRPTMDEMYQRLACASMLKHFDSVQDKFHKIRCAGDPVESHEHHHLECLRLAQERFEIWGQVLSLREVGISSHCLKLPEKTIEVLTRLFHILWEEPDKRAHGDSTILRSFQDGMDRSIKEIWDLLPSELVVQASTYLRQSSASAGPQKQLQKPFHTAHDKLPSECGTASSTSLLRELDDLSQSFKNDLPECTSLDELLKAKSVDEVYDIIDNLQSSQELRNLAKMKPCLERLHGYTKVMNNTINGSREYFAFVWGPLGLLLRQSREFDTAYIAVINAMAKLGEALPDFQAPENFLRHNTESKELLVLFLKDLLSFYSVTLQPFSHPGWMFVFDRSWPKTWALILEVSSHMLRLNRLMRTEVRLEHIHQEYEFRKNALEVFKKQARETRQQEFGRIKTSLKPREYNDTLYELRGLCSPGTGNWLFSNKHYTEWLDISQGESRVLWLKGIPGAGKTVLSSTVVDHLKSEQWLTCFVFLTYKDEKISALSIMHSLIFQLAERDDELVEVVCESMDEELKSNLATAKDLLKSLILHAGRVCLVVDGVDEISKGERDRMVTELLDLVKSCEGLAVMLSSRPEADLIRALHDAAIVIQVHDHNEQSIECFVKEFTQKMFKERGVVRKGQDEIEKLLAPLARRAEGMFLYARLIMEMVGTMHDLSEIRNELAVLPENLDDAYHRIILRLDKHNNKLNTEKAKRLLGWIACSLIPLTIEEAQQALAVEPRNPKQTYSAWAKLDPVELLGPIVETTGGYISFVHFTAKEYVSSTHLGTPLIDISQSSLELATRCIDYLCQCHHDSSLSSQHISEKLLSGQYSLDAFASRMWFELSCQYLRSVEALDVSANFVESINKLWGSRRRQSLLDEIDLVSDVHNGGDSQYAGQDELYDEWVPGGIKQHHPLLHHLLSTVSRFRRLSFVYTGEADQVGIEHLGNEQDPLSLLDTSKRIRTILDKNLCNEPSASYEFTNQECHENCTNILLYYGQRPFKCKFPRCEFWRHGFRTRTSRQRHERSHEKPLKCHVFGCKFGQIGFLSERMRQKHLQAGHTSDPPRPSFDARNLDDDSVGPLLHYLVAENQVEDVRGILSTLSFPEIYKTQELQLLASLAASPAMLQLLGDDLSPEAQVACIVESMKGRNRMTMEYNLARLLRFISKAPRYWRYLKSPLLYKQLFQTGWLDGLKTWCASIREFMATRMDGDRYNNTSWMVSDLVGHKAVSEAAKHPFGEQMVLFMWNASGLLPNINDIPDWASRTLRAVASSGCSITLAIELLHKGADINHRIGDHARSVLHCAAGNNSAKGAEMMRFLLLQGADPEATLTLSRHPVSGETTLRRIRDEEGAKNIRTWLGKTWDELVEETRQSCDE